MTFEQSMQSGFHLLTISHTQVDRQSRILILNLLEAPDQHTAAELISLKYQYQQQGINLIHLWKDIWFLRQKQVLNRLCSLLAIGQLNVHGRKTKVVQLSQQEADDFMESHHLQGAVKSRYKLALQHGTDIVAVATFSAKRKMTRISADYQSIELIRFANASGLNVQGGLSKILKHLIALLQPDDVMTYADLDWSTGAAYEKLGFKMVEQQEAAQIWLDSGSGKRYFSHRLPENKADHTFIPLFNTGNLKYILYL